jgi:4-amino-4-deoxy-L-arabinose transferase-like glycosyltransferase
MLPAPENSRYFSVKASRRIFFQLTKVDLYVALALAASTIIWLWPFRTTLAFLDRDEGIILQGATRILHGELPYRDFFSFYTPGSYFWNALFFKIFNDSIMVSRSVLVAYGMIFSVLTFILARYMGSSRRTAAFISGLLLICALPARFVVIHSWDTTMAAFLALSCAVWFLRRPNHWLAMLTGWFTAMAILFNQARGLGFLLGLALAFPLLWWKLKRREMRAVHFITMATTIVLPLLITVVFFALCGSFRPMVDCLLWPLHNYSAANHLPYGYITMSTASWNQLFFRAAWHERAMHYFILSPIILICALPIFIVLVAFWCVLSRRDDLDHEHVSVAILCGAVVFGSILSTLVARPDFLHITFVAPLFFFLLPWVFAVWAAPFRSLRKLEPLVVVYIVIAFAAYGLTLVWPQRNSGVLLETRRGAVRTSSADAAVSFIQENFPPGSKLLVHPYLPLYSFLTRTSSPLYYDYLQAGMHTRKQFHDAATQLAQLRPESVLFEPGFIQRIPPSWPNTPVSDMIQDPVADYIIQNYRVCRVLGPDSEVPFLFMVRKNLDCETVLANASRMTRASAR